MGGWNEMRISQWDIKLGCRKAEDERVYSVDFDSSLYPVARAGSDPPGSLEASSAECPLLQSLGLQPSWLCELLQKNGFAEPRDSSVQRADHWVMWVLSVRWQEYAETIRRDKCDDVYECFGCGYDVNRCTICVLGAWGGQDIGFPETGVTDACELPGRARELNPDPLQDQQVLLTAEPTLQPVAKYFKLGQATNSYAS